MRFQRDIPILVLQGNETFKGSGVGNVMFYKEYSDRMSFFIIFRFSFFSSSLAVTISAITSLRR